LKILDEFKISSADEYDIKLLDNKYSID